jgi:hypothetical protein
MSQRSAHFTKPGALPDRPDDATTPVFATSILGIGGIRFPMGGHK